MKKYLILLLLLFPLATAAQEAQAPAPKKERYAPGKWYAGIKREYIPFEVGMGINRVQWGLLGGYHLLPRLTVQTGVTLTNLRRRSFTYLPQALLPPFETYTGFVHSFEYSAGLYIPVMLRYSFLKPFGRVQPYALAGMHFYYARRQFFLGRYDNGQLTDTQVFPKRSYAGFGAGAGFGLRIRVVNRFSLYSEFTLGRLLQKNASLDYQEAGQEPLRDAKLFATTLCFGVIYDFK